MTSGPARVSILRQGHYLIASVHTALDDSELQKFKQVLLTGVTQHHSRGVIIDVAALDVLDSFATQALADISEMVRLQGAATVIIGIRPDTAYAVTLFGMNTASLATALDLTDGMSYLNHRTSQPRPIRR